jgi:DNA polymerase III subunit alpha
MSEFVHLHLHSQYSVLDGAIKFKDLIAKSKVLGSTAVGLTDHGTMHGAVEFYQQAKDAGIKPIIGCEVYLASKGRLIKDSGDRDTFHLTLLAKSNEGYRNLCKLVSLGFIEGFYFKPRIDHEILKLYAKDIICLSGCISSELASFTKRGDLEGARSCALLYQSIFGKNYFLEVQPHQFEEQKIHNQVVKELNRTLGIPIVATNDCHYLHKEDHYAQEVLMCVSMGKLITDPDRIRHEHAHLHLKTFDEMKAGLPDFEEALCLTRDIAKSCEIDFDFSKYYMPQFELKKEETLEEVFATAVKKGLEERLDAAKILKNSSEYTRYYEQLELELTCILEMGFAGYFLVVSDFILWAKREGIPVGPGRGSAAGSLVAFALYITEIDPIKYSLLFERFLNPERVSLPDIDVDFCIFGREKVIEYVCEKYGKDKVAQIVTFGTLKAKAAIKDVGRALGWSYAETDKIAKLVPAPRQGFDYPLGEALKMEKKLQEYAEGEGKDLIELALKLEGLSRHTSTHAAGLVIADKPIVEYLPLMVDKDGQIVTQFSMNWVEKIGLVKFDFLGLKTLSVLDEALRLIDEHHSHHFKGTHWLDLNGIPLDDEKTFQLVSSGRTIGVFQLESSGITEMVTRLKPNCFEDLVAILALYRPGPLDAGMVDHYINRKHGRETVSYMHPSLETILKDTYGIILYQEQIMQIARDMAGYTLAEADMLRRAMGKKKPEEMAKQRSFFLEGARKRKINDTVAAEVFDQMETFARYGFNRSHSVAYAMISYQTAYLKAHYPRQFLAALMTFEKMDTDKTLKNLNECHEMKIRIQPPNVNSGGIGFSVVGKDILYGLAAIKGVGDKIIERVVEERKEGPFTGLLDFCVRLGGNSLNRRVVENLIKSGAFDWTAAPRKELHDHVEEVLKIATRIRDRHNSPQIGLFDAHEPEVVSDDMFLPKIARSDWPSNILLSKEREALGFYLSGHPLERFRDDVSRLGMMTTSAVKESADGSTVQLAGVITFLKLKNTKKGDRYATCMIEDLLGTLETVVWPDTYRELHEILNTEEPLMLKGRVDSGDERCVFVLQQAKTFTQLRDESASEAVIKLHAQETPKDKIVDLKKVLLKYKGSCKVTLMVQKPLHSETSVLLPEEMWVQPSEDLCNELERLFGENVLSFR